MFETLFDTIAQYRSRVYDRIIVAMTTEWYRQALLTMPNGASVLDVGIGTATSLLNNERVLMGKDLTFTGVDYDDHYVTVATRSIAAKVAENQQQTQQTQQTNDKQISNAATANASLVDPSRIKMVCASIHDFNTDYQQQFDVIYFSGSFMIIPNQVGALKHCVRMLRKTSIVPPVTTTTTTTTATNDTVAASPSLSSSSSSSPLVFTQTFERPGLVGSLVALFKPLFKYVLTIDFGNATFEQDFRAVCDAAGVQIDEVRTIRGTPFRREVLVLASPKPE